MKKPNWFVELESALVVSMAVVGLGVVATVVGVITRDPIPVTVPNDMAGVANMGAGGLVSTEDGSIDMVMNGPTWAQTLLGVLNQLPTPIVVLTLLAVLHRVVRRMRRGGPFDEVVVRRVRLLGWIAGVGGMLAVLIEASAEAFLTLSADLHGISFWLPIMPGLLSWPLIGIGLLALAEVLRRGVVMRTELDTVI
ncbi:DUF2975 domain-containing protein [Dactylosporangium sp. NPDC051541]|uniref:DUF2975 domain-containing protein n=1 Tax=Dactylosporangium sp. NPDC051541 TaxID=3363977 RepID=UPI00378FBF6E